MEFISGITANRPLSALVLFLISFALYLPSLKNDFVWDDIEVISENNISYDPSNIIYYVVPTSIENKQARYYRPVVYVSWVADSAIWKMSPPGYHLSNIVLNSASAVLFYLFVILLLREFRPGGNDTAAFLSALLFTVYPMHVESVSWIAGRTDVFCALFLFLALIMHIYSYKRSWLLVLAGLGFLLSVFSKEVAVVFPLLAVVMDLMSRRFYSRINILKYSFYLGVLLIYLYLRAQAFSVPSINDDIVTQGMNHGIGSGNIASSITLYVEAIKILLSAYYVYLSKLIWPFDFNVFMTEIPREAYVLISSIILFVLSAVVSFISVQKRERVTAFGIIWIWITLAPSAVIAIVSISSTPLAERYLYIPSAGFCLLAGYWIAEAGLRARYKRMAWGAGVVLVIAYVLMSYHGQSLWKNDLMLWKNAASKSPYHPLPHSNYGLALLNAGKYDEAIRELGIALSPELKDSPRGLAITANNLALVYLEKAEYEKAEKWFRKALEYDPDYGKTYYHMGLIYYINGELTGSAASYREAEQYVKETMKRYRYYGRANLLLAKIYIRTGDKEKAVQEARKAIAIGLPENLLDEARNILEVDDGGGDQEPNQHREQ